MLLLRSLQHVLESGSIELKIPARPSHRVALLFHQEGHRFAFMRGAHHFFALTIFSARTSSSVSASIFFSSAFSFSSPLSFWASSNFKPPYLRFQRWNVTSWTLCSRQTSRTV